MPDQQEIKSEKIVVKEIFSNMWFRIPEYQRPYIWTRDEVNELLDDLTFAMLEKPDSQYFLGSFVFQTKKANPAKGQKFEENDLLDGQQRMTTLFMLFACIRDLSDDGSVRENCEKSLFQKGDRIDKIPQRTRIVFAIRREVQDFVDEFVKAAGGTTRTAELEQLAATSTDASIPNMARAILEMRGYLSNPERALSLEDLLGFIRNEVLLIYVSTENLDDAFRLFMILNNRGKPLRNSDILKSMNLGAVEDDTDKLRYAEMWEKAEGDLGDEFDRFLNYLRTILVKDKARMNLLQEFEDKIYEPKEKDKATNKPRSPLLTKGKATFEMVERYLGHHGQMLEESNYDFTGNSFQFDNLIKVMSLGLPATDWVPPLLRYFDKFKYAHLLRFVTRLDNKFSGDWVAQYSPTQRIENMNQIIRVVEAAASADAVLADACFGIDQAAFLRNVEAAVYGRRFTRYLLIKLDYLYQDHAHRLAVESLSVEHVLPQNPAANSRWRIDFTEAERQEWTNKLGNLVLITTRKNTSQGNSDYDQKKTKYFAKKINTCPNSLRVLNNAHWTPKELKANHQEVLTKIRQHYGITATAP